MIAIYEKQLVEVLELNAYFAKIRYKVGGILFEEYVSIDDLEMVEE